MSAQYGVNISADRYGDEEIRLIRTSDIDEQSLLAPPDSAVYVDREGARGLLLEPGDLLFSRSGTLGRCLLYGGAPDSATFAGYLVRFRTKTEIDPRYIWFSAQAQFFSDQIAADAVQSTISNFNAEKYGNVRLPWHPPPQQRAIVAYLDYETARIDALIETKKRMVEVLEERWHTIRLRSTRPGRSLGRGGTIQLRRVARLQAGAAFPHAHQGDSDGTIPYVKVGDLSNIDEHGGLRGADNRVTPEIAMSLRSPVLPPGTIVLPKIGAALLTNRRAILTEASCLDQNVMGVTAEAGNPRFVYHCLGAVDFGELSTPGPVPLLNEEAALSVRIPWPSTEEQNEIVKTLDSCRATAKKTADLLGAQLSLLQERRQALITAAVTGQPETAA